MTSATVPTTTVAPDGTAPQYSARPPRVLPPAELDRPIRCGSIHNPLAWRNSRRGELSAALSIHSEVYPEARHFEVDSPADIESAVDVLLGDDVELLVVNGGDGTVQAVLTALLGRSPERALPLIAVLPGGTTNMIAGDVGIGGDHLRALARILAAARTGRLAGTVIERPVIRAEFEPGRAPIFAMFFGAGAVYHGIRFCRRHLTSHGLRGEVGPGAALAVFLTRILFGSGGSLFPPLNASTALDGRAGTADSYFGILVSTLDRLFLGLRPFWGREPGTLRYSALCHSHRHLLRAVFPIMRGKPNRFVRPEFGYQSHNAQEIRLLLDSGFTLDGELYETQPGVPVVLRGGARAHFLADRSA